ncbi:MAG: glycosyltransferase [Chloroflexi bacterium]|nr:glycosyltransferase [Chloroflexota bacterium]
MAAPTFSIILPVLESPTLADALRAIQCQTAFDQIVEILVVGRQEKEPLPEMPKVRYLPVTEQPSPAHNRNVGASQAQGEWLCFTDSDCTPQADWLAQLAGAVSGAEVALAGTVAIPPETGYWGRCDHLFGFADQAQGRPHGEWIKSPATLNFCIRAEQFAASGGFEESFLSAAGEDLEFAWRLRRSGVKTRLIPQAVVVHRHARADFRSAWKHCFGYGAASAQFRAKRGGSRLWSLFSPVLAIPLTGELVGAGRVLLRGLARPFRYPDLLRSPWLLPGIGLLDAAHTWGMLRGVRHAA